MLPKASIPMPGSLQHRLKSPMTFWVVGVSFVLFQFFLQLSSGVVIDAVMKDLALSASEAGLLASAYYYVYVALQMPVGMLFDKKNIRLLLTLNVLICSLGCLLFAYSQNFWSLMFSRLVIGAGSAFAFVGVSHLLRVHFPLSRFGFMIGLTETLAFLVSVVFMLMMGVMASDIHWRHLMLYAGLTGLVITFFCALLLPDDKPVAQDGQLIYQAVKKLCLDKIAWLNGLFVGLGFAFITVFGAMWAIPFIQLKTGCDLKMATILDAILFLGAGLSCPLFGMIEMKSPKRCPVLCLSYFLTALTLVFILFGPVTSLWWMGSLLFLTGLCSGAYMLSYTIANEISPPHAESTSTGFANTLAILTAPLLQPLVGCLLDANKQGADYSLADYQFSLMIIPIGLLIGGIIAFWLPEKR